MIQEKDSDKLRKFCKKLEHLFLKESLHILKEDSAQIQMKEQQEQQQQNQQQYQQQEQEQKQQQDQQQDQQQCQQQDQQQDQQQYQQQDQQQDLQLENYQKVQQQNQQQNQQLDQEQDQLQDQQQDQHLDCQKDQQQNQQKDDQQEQSSESNEIQVDNQNQLILKQNQIQYDIKIKIYRNNIVDQKCDVIVNTANKQLWEGGGVCGFIFRACGSEQLRQKCIDVLKQKKKQYIRTSEAVITESCKLAEKGGPKWIIHAAGPIWKPKKQNQELVYDKCKGKLRLTIKLAFITNNFSSISIPAISSGIYRFPKDVCAKIFHETIDEFKQDMMNKPNPREIVIGLCNFDHETTEIFEKEFGILRELNY